MKIIDLTAPIFDRMPVYPGDPPVRVRPVHFIKQQGWRLKQLEISTHTGTHVDAFSHMDSRGRSLDSISLDNFFGKAIVVEEADDFPKNTGLVFSGKKELKVELLEKILSANPKFVAVGDGKGHSSLSIELERKLLHNKIVTFTDLVNIHKLPKNKTFTFYGFPLKIKGGDGSPVRAVAIL